MMHAARAISYPPAGQAVWRPGCLPRWLGFEPLSLPEGPEAAGSPVIWSADFSTGSYVRLGVEATLAEMLTTVRSSPAGGFDAVGNYQVFGVNEPAILPDIGIDIWGQFTALWANGHNPGTSPWANNAGCGRVAVGGVKGSLFCPCFVNASADYTPSSYAGTARPGSISVSSGSPVTIRARYARGSTNRFRLLLAEEASGNVTCMHGEAGALAMATAAAGDATVRNIVEAEGYTAIVTFVPNFSGSARVCVGPDGNVPGSAEESILWGLDGVAGSQSPPWISNGSPAPTRLATDHRIREFATLAAIEDFSDGIRVAAKIDLSSLYRDAVATIAAFGENAANCVKLQIGTDNKVHLILRRGGVDELDLATGSAFTAPGEKEIVALVTSGHFVLTATGLENAESEASVLLPDLAGSDPSIGSLWNTAHLQGVLKRFTVERAVS